MSIWRWHHEGIILIHPVLFNATPDTMSNLLCTYSTSCTQLPGLEEISSLVFQQGTHTFPYQPTQCFTHRHWPIIRWATLLDLVRAIRLAPAKNLPWHWGRVFPVTRMLTTEEQMGVGRGMLATSRRCCTWRPKRPATVSLGKELKFDIMLKSGCNETRVGSRSYWCATAGQLGCLTFNAAMWYCY